MDGVTARRAALADRALGALEALGGEASTLEIREHLKDVEGAAAPHRLLGALNRLSRRQPAPVSALGSGNGGRGHPQRWRLAGYAPQEGRLDGVLPWPESKAAGRNARKLRDSAGRTQESVARAAWIAPSMLSAYERGTVRIPVVRARALAEVLGTTAEELAGEGGGP